LPGTRTQQGPSEVEAHGLWKLGQVSRMEKGLSRPFLVLRWPLCALVPCSTSKQGRASGCTLLLYMK
jgi:hypothetical protein